MREPTKEELAYIAGFIDGEGSFSICKTKSTPRKMADGSKKIYVVYKLVVDVTNTNRTVLDLIHNMFGGGVYPGNQKKRNPRYLPRFAWRCNNTEERERFIEAILPYLRMKRKQAKLALKFSRMYKQEGLHKKREEMRKQMQTLNHSPRLR